MSQATPGENPPMVVIYATAPDRETALSLARGLVAARLAACVNVHGPMQSLYFWDGAVQQDEEFALVIKTLPGQFEAVRDHLTTHHPYDVPPVMLWPVTQVNAPYLDWMKGYLEGR